MRSDQQYQAGQMMVLLAFVMLVLLTGIGLAIDASEAYYYSATAERAAAAGALSGVIFMPKQFLPSQAIPVGSGNDATDRAVKEAVRNGHGITSGMVTASQVAGESNQLQVTVSMTVATLFMRVFGFNTYPIARSAVAEYLSPITLGQPGSQAGSTVSQLGTGNNYYFMREEGWATDRSQGDAYTPDPATEYGGTLSPAAQDVHVISGANDISDPDLPARGGYNYLIDLPAGGSVQVYDAAFAPDGNGGLPHNYCENSKLLSNSGPIGPCSLGGSYYMHEEDSVDFSDPTTFAAMEYTLFRVNNTFIHNTDTELAQMTVLPIDASNWSASNKNYVNVNTGGRINQNYWGDGSPVNMQIYHSWIDVTNYNGSGDGGLVDRALTYGPKSLPAGTYRLRVDTLNYDGSLPPGNQLAHKAYAVRAVDTSGNPCSACTVGAISDMSFYTPINTVGGGSFTMPIFQVPPSYAGRTISVDVYDAGDISGAGNVDVRVLDPSGNLVTSTAPDVINVYDLGVDRTTTSSRTLIQSGTTASYRATTGGTILYNGHWVELQVPVPASYNPGMDPADWSFSLQYVTGSGVTSTDTLTVAAGLAGAPAHLLPI